MSLNFRRNPYSKVDRNSVSFSQNPERIMNKWGNILLFTIFSFYRREFNDLINLQPHGRKQRAPVQCQPAHDYKFHSTRFLERFVSNFPKNPCARNRSFVFGGSDLCLIQSILYCVPGPRERETQRSLYRDGRPERLDRLSGRTSPGQDPEP